MKSSRVRDTPETRSQNYPRIKRDLGLESSGFSAVIQKTVSKILYYIFFSDRVTMAI